MIAVAAPPGIVTSDCLSQDEFHSLLNDALDIDRLAMLHGHIEFCDDCQRCLDELAICADGRVPQAAAAPGANSNPPPDFLTSLRQSLPSVLTGADARTRNGKTTSINSETHKGRGLDDLKHDVEIMPGDQGHLHFVSAIGEGGTAVVYRGRDEAVCRDVAIKVLRWRYRDNSDIRAQLRRETEILAQFTHAGVPQVLESGELDDGRLYSVMEFRPGKTFSHRLRNAGPAEVVDLLDHFCEVCQVVASAHQRGIRHGDIKPSNVLVDDSGTITVLDWGLAEEITGDHGGLPTGISSLCRTIGGTPGYMSPEQLRGNEAGLRADVFSLGMILAEVLAGQSVAVDERYSMDAQQAVAAAVRIVEILEQRGISRRLVDLVQRCISPDPHDRPRDAGELLSELCCARSTTGGRSARRTDPSPFSLVARVQSRSPSEVRMLVLHGPIQKPLKSLLDWCKKSAKEPFNECPRDAATAPALH